MKKFFQGKIKILIMIAFLFLFFFNTVAYSGLASKLAITSEAMFRASADIRVTGIKLESASNGAVENYSPKYNVDNTTTGFTLPNANSSITYRVTVTNYGDRNQTIYSFIKQSINKDGINVTVTGYKEKDIIKFNTSVEFLITITATTPDTNPINLIEQYEFRKVYTVEYQNTDGTQVLEPQYKYEKESLKLREDVLTKTDYDFKGWTCSLGDYAAGSEYTLDQDIILYPKFEKKKGKLDLNYNIDGTWYYSGYNNKIQTGIKVAGSDKGYLNDFGGTYEYGTSYEIYGFKIDGVTIPYSKKYTVDGNNYLNISFNTINFTVNNANLGSITPTQLIVIPGTTFTVSSNVITLLDGRIATASTKDVTGYKTKFSSYTITPNSTTINAKTTAQANFTKEAEKYTITLDNKSATTAGTTAIYEKYNTGIYLDGALTKAMTTSINAITKPSKTGYTFKGYYIKENGQGDQIINENGYITDKITNTTYTANITLYAYYKDDIKPTLTLTNSSNGNWTNKDVTITLNGADSGSGIKEYQLKYSGSSNVWKKTTAPKDTWGAERNETVYYRAVDNAGNESDAVSTSIRIDKTTPKIELNGAASSSEINNSNNVTIPIKITETASGINNSEFTASDISVLINGTTVNPSTKTLTYNSVSNGIYSYTLTLSGITLNGKVTLEIAAGAVKDIATNSNAKTTLDPSITVSNIYTISLNGNGATTVGTPAIYEKYNTGIYLDSTLTKAMTTSTNPIPTTPSRSYTVSFNANNTGITIPSAITKSYSYSGYYTDATAGTQMINENGYITSSFKNTSYTSDGTLYAHWKAKPSVTIPAISKTGYTCSWNTSADGNGTTYNAGDVTDKLNTQTLYAVCKANSYTVSYNSNGGSGTMTNDTATYNSNFITKKNTFTKTGYTFNGWNEKADGTGTVWGLTTSGVYESGKTWKWTYAKNITLYAQWKANTNTKYIVKHCKQKLDGTYSTEADDTENLTGTTGASVSPAVKDVKNNSNYIGFTAPSVQTVTIAADGSTVVTYKYTRNKYTFTLGSATGVSTSGSTASGSYYYGSTITLKASASSGYTWSKWTSSNTSLVGNQTTANTTFTMPAGNITMTPSVTVNSYTVTYDATTNGGSTAKQTASTKYKTSVDLTKKAEKTGYEFVGWNTNKDATSALASYEMPANDVTLYAIYSKTLTATFNYYNSKSETKSVTIYNNATSGSITSPAALGTPSGYTFRHYSTSNAANASKTIDANSAVVLTSNQTYYASYQKTVTLNFYYHSGTDTYANTQTSTTATGVQYLGYNNAIVNSTVSIPSAVTGSTGYYGTSYKGVTAANSTTPISVNTGTTNYYAYYQVGITYYYYNGSTHTTGTGTRTAYSNGTNYVTTASTAPTPSAYDGASFKGWSYTNDSVNDRNPAYTAMTVLYAYYQKTVSATFNYYDGSKAASVTAGNTRTYISKSGGVNTINTNITIPDAVKASRGSYTYRGISTSNAANASVVTSTTANTTYYSSYTYAITANFTANGGTGTAPSSAAGTGYMNYSGSKIGISVTMPSNTFTRNGYTFGGWYDAIANKTYTAGTSATIDSSRNFNATWNVVTYTIKYNLNGGTVSATNPTSYKVTDADITLNNPTKPGYTFTGWTGTGLSESSKAVTIKSGSYGNREYTANYSINQYYYDVNPDSGIKSFDITIDGKTSTGLTDYYQKLNYGKEATITNVVAKPGYTYTGYNTTGSMTILTGSTNSNIKTKLGAGNGYIALTSTAKTLKFDAQTLDPIKYSTTPQALVFKGADNGTGSYKYEITAGNTNGYFNINGTTITTSDKVVPPVGTYKLTVTATDNTSLVTATADITIVIEKASSTNPTLTAYSGTYDGQQHTIGVTGGSGGTIQYSTDNKTWSTTKPTRTSQGTTTVYVKVVGDSNHTDTSVISSTITINFATITYTASSYEGFYDGNQHTISVSVTKPTSGATITYSLTENGTYSATKPTVTNATTTPVTVYFKISASNYNTVSSKATITINKTNSVSPTLTAYSGTYDGKSHTIGVTGGSGGTIKYSTDQTNWSTTLPTRTDATTTPVTVYVKVFGDGNHKDTSIISSTITINKKTDVITMSSISTNYTGREVEATATAESKTTITYTYYNGTTCSGTALSSAPVNVGDYSVKATSAGNNNYKSNSACATIKISNTNNPTTVSAVTGLKYGSTGNLVTTSNVQGTIYYSIGTELTSSNYKTSGSTSIPTASGKNAGTYKVYYYVDATETNYESTKGGPVSVTIGKAPGSISYATKSVTKDYGNASFVNTLTKTGDGIVGYSSSNTGVATIDASGRVTIIAAGTTTITAKVTDGTNYTYSTKTATYTLVVNKIENTAKVSPVTGIIYGEEKSMVSTTGVQGTIYYSVGTVLTESNYLSVGSVTIPTSKGRNAGTYNIYYYVTGNSNYKVVSNNSSNPVAVVIGKKQDVVSITEKSATYTESAIGANTATATSGTGITYTYYSSQDCSGTALSGAPINKGNYSVKATSAGNSNYTSGIKCVKHTIDFGTPTISLGDTTKTYTGSPITSVGAIGKNPNGSSVSLNYTYTYYNGTTCSGTAISAPVNYNANNYSVKATSTATSNLKSATSNCAKLTINKAAATNPTLTAYSGTYDGQAHTIGVTGGNGGTIQYSTDNKTWSTTKTTRTDVGTTTVYVKVVGDSNHTDTNSISSTITIKAQQLSNPTNMKISTAGIVTWDSVPNATKYQISIDGTNWTDATSGVDYLSKIIASTGTRTVYVKAIGTGNYATGSAGSKSVTVYAVNFSSNSTTMGTVDTSSYNVINGTTYASNSNKLSLNGITTGTTSKTLKTVTATAKTNYVFKNWSSSSGTVSSNITITANFTGAEYTITLNGNGASTAGTSAIYERYASGIYLDSGINSKQMTTSANPITKPSKSSYTVTYDANNTGVTVSNATFTPSFNGYYTATSSGTQMINNSGYITSNLTNTKYTANTTLYAQWNHGYKLSSVSKTGYTCSWNTKSDGTGTKYSSGATVSITANTTYYAICNANEYTVEFVGNGGTSSSSSMNVTYGKAYGTLPKATRANNGNIKYTFEGWYTAATGGEKEKVTKIESTTTYNTAGNQTLYAHWLSSPIIKGGTSEVWSGSSIEILLDTPSKSDTSDTIKYQYYLSTSQTEQVGGTWIDVTSVDGGVAIYENGKHYIFYRAINVNRDISSVSNYNTLLIDSVTPSVTLSAYHRGNGQKIESDQWTNAGLRFEFGDLTAGPSGATIYYCISDSISCIPNKVASPNQAVTDSTLDNKTGVYKFIYQVSSNAGVDSKTFTFIAKVDTTAPTMKGVITSLKDSSTLATLTNSSTSYVDSTWRNYGYTINLSGTTDGESGIAKIEKYTNANNLSRSDTDYKSNLVSGDITSTKIYTEKANGAKYAKYVATDNAGNKATFIVEVLIDTEGPTMKGVITSLKDSSTLATLTNSSTSYVDSSWKNYGYKITLSGTDSLSGISKITKYTNANNLKKTDSNYKSNLVSGDITSTKTHSESADGAKYAKFVATDKAGNTTTFTVEVLIDTVAPNPVIKLYKANSDEKKTGSVLKTIDTSVNTAINSWTNYRHYFDLSSSTDSLSGIKEMKMQINDYGIFATGNTAAGTTDLVTTYDFSTNKYIVVGHSGNRYIRFTIRDKAGNSVVRNIRVYIDLEDPVLSSPKIADRFSSSTTLTYSCGDAMSGFQPFGKSDPKAVEIVFTELKIKSSSSPVTIQCKDTAGNTSTSKTYRWGANSVCGKNSSGGNKTCWHQ